jgi:quinol monooxygenase YgiN
MVLATVRLMIPPKKRDEALKILKSAAAQCRVLPSCLSCHIYADVQEDNVLMFEQTWRSQEDLERHLRSDEYYRVLLVMEMALKQPEIRFEIISGSTGIETVEKARGFARRVGGSEITFRDASLKDRR